MSVRFIWFTTTSYSGYHLKYGFLGGELQPRDAHQVLCRYRLRQDQPQQGDPQGERQNFFWLQLSCLRAYP